MCVSPVRGGKENVRNVVGSSKVGGGGIPSNMLEALASPLLAMRVSGTAAGPASAVASREPKLTTNAMAWPQSKADAPNLKKNATPERKLLPLAHLKWGAPKGGLGSDAYGHWTCC